MATRSCWQDDDRPPLARFGRRRVFMKAASMGLLAPVLLALAGPQSAWAMDDAEDEEEAPIERRDPPPPPPRYEPPPRVEERPAPPPRQPDWLAPEDDHCVTFAHERELVGR